MFTKNNRIVFGFIIAILMLFSSSAFAQSQNISAEKIALTKRAKANAVTDEKWGREIALKDSEIRVLTEQNKLIREYQSSILDTVYWALTSMIGLITLVVGLNWWSNTKVYEKDKAQFAKTIDAGFKEADLKFSRILDENRQNLERSTEEKNAATIERVARESAEVRAELTGDRTNTNLQLQELRAADVTATEAIVGLNKEIAWQEASLRKVEEYVWDTRGVPGNILVTLIQGAKAAVAAGRSHEVKDRINKFKIILDKEYVGTDRTFSSKGIREHLIDGMETFTASHPGEVAEIVAILKTIPIEDPKV